jgi:ArsR family transcriptional regulator
MKSLARIFKALSDTNRLRILKMLEIRPLCVCEIVEVLRLANSTVSAHLAILRDAGFIIDEKDGKWVNYYLKEYPDNLYIAKLLPLISEWLPDDRQISDDRIKLQSVNRVELCNL